MLKVLFISHDAVPYGAPKSMVNIIDGLQQQVCFVVLLPYEGGIKTELEIRGIKNYVSRYFWDVYSFSNFKDFMFLPVRLTRHYLAHFKTLQLIKNLHKTHNFDIIHSNSGVVRVGFFAAKILKIPHIWHVREFQTKDYNLNILFGRKYFIKLLNKTEKTICVSQSIQKYFEIQDGNVIYNGVMPKSVNEITFEKENYFVFAASLIPQKGVFDVLEAFVKFSHINKTTRLFICGTGNEENIKKINKIIDNAGLQDRVKLLGYRNDILQLLKEAKACIVPSHYEAFGRITAEAMLLGCPVIGKASEGTLEIIQDSRYGSLYNSKEELVNAMIFQGEPSNNAIISKMINAAKIRADKLFTQEQLCSNILEVYHSVSNK